MKFVLKNLRLVAVVAILIVAILVVALTHHSPKISSSKCGTYRTDKIVQIGSTRINAEVAKSVSDQDKGLSGRSCIDANQGMLFVFNHPGYYAFWMKDMRFPIDIVWIGADHKLAGLQINVAPSTYPDRFVNKDHLAQYVLELQANRSKSLHLGYGSTLNF